MPPGTRAGRDVRRDGIGQEAIPVIEHDDRSGLQEILDETQDLSAGRAIGSPIRVA
jgi:hypothetical protein